MNKYGIIGLGWLGLELAKALKKDNLSVWGTTTSTKKLEMINGFGIEALYFEILENGCKGEIFDHLKQTTHLFLNIPPGLRKDSQTDYVKKLSNFLDLISENSIQHLIYVSSTSVFQDQKGIPEYTENSEPNASSKTANQLIKAENLILELQLPTVQLLRLGGLIGGERHPAKYLSGRKQVSNPEAPVNMIRREDVIQLSKRLFLYKKSGVFHGVFPDFPTRRVFYTQACKAMNLESPGFIDLEANLGKKISSLKTSNELNYNFNYQP